MTPAEAQTAIVAYFAKSRPSGKNLKYGDGVDRHRGFFAGRRANSIGTSNASLLADSNLSDLKSRIEMEYAQVDIFIEKKITDLKAGHDKSPGHLDLADVAKPKTTTAASEARKRKGDYAKARAYRLRAIAWRAAGIHTEFWKPSTDGKTAALLTDVFDQVIDRRLHMVERMNFQVSRADVIGGAWSFTGSGQLGPWKDGFRIRMFEYPRISRNAVSQVVGFVGAGNIADASRRRFQSTDPAWQWEPGKHRLLYNHAPEPGLHFPLASDPDWKVDADRYFRDLAPDAGKTAASVIDAMFKPDEDWWQRNWLFCDHVISSLHIEALLFGLRRRDPAHGEAEFNGLVTNQPAGFVSIGNFLATEGIRKLGRLMAMEVADPNSNLGSDPYFDNEPIAEEDLQIGDHLIFYNSHIFSFISGSEWSLENSVVIDVDSDEAGGMHRSNLTLQGHGTAPKTHNEYMKEVIQPLDETLGLVRSAIQTALASDSSKTAVDWLGISGRLVRWDPYEHFPAPGAWWVKVPVSAGDLAEALRLLPGAVAQDPNPGSGYHPPPDTTAAYFPLYRPKMPNFWDGYLSARRKSSVRLPKLDAYKADASITPGIFYGGKKAPIPTLRPKAIP